MNGKGGCSIENSLGNDVGGYFKIERLYCAFDPYVHPQKYFHYIYLLPFLIFSLYISPPLLTHQTQTTILVFLSTPSLFICFVRYRHRFLNQQASLPRSQNPTTQKMAEEEIKYDYGTVISYDPKERRLWYYRRLPSSGVGRVKLSLKTGSLLQSCYCDSVPLNLYAESLIELVWLGGSTNPLVWRIHGPLKWESPRYRPSAHSPHQYPPGPPVPLYQRVDATETLHRLGQRTPSRPERSE